MAKEEKKKVNRNELRQKKLWHGGIDTIGKESEFAAATFVNSYMEVTVKMLNPDEMKLPLFFRDEKMKVQCSDHEFILEETQMRLRDFTGKSGTTQKELEFKEEEHFIKED